MKILLTHLEHWIRSFWTIAPRRNNGLGPCKLLVTFLSTKRHITMFYVCFCLKKSYLIYIVDSLTVNSQNTPLSLVPEGSLFNRRNFSKRHFTALLCLGTLDSTILEEHFKQWHRQLKIQNWEQCGPKSTLKRTLVYSMRDETRRQSSCLVCLQLGMCASSNSNSFPLSVCPQMTRKVMVEYRFPGYK